MDHMDEVYVEEVYVEEPLPVSEHGESFELKSVVRRLLKGKGHLEDCDVALEVVGVWYELLSQIS